MMCARLFVIFCSMCCVLSSPGKDNPGEDDPIEINRSYDQRSFLVDDMAFANRNTRTKRQAYDDDHKWPKNGDTVTVPYVISGNIDKKSLKRAVEVFNAKTCIRFVPRGSQSDYVSFQHDRACNADVGYRGGKQICRLSTKCGAKKGKILHEMMHVLNFLHEQCRSDRDTYIAIHRGNIREKFQGNFDIINGKNLGIPYDCDSILHYKTTAFTKNGQPTITLSKCSQLGNDDTRLSLLDYKRVNTLYGCSKPNYRYFTVQVDTDSSWTSGTDCFIYLTLHGNTKTSSEFELDNSGSSDPFERGDSDYFKYMAYRDDLGPITGISVRMVANGRGQAWWPSLFKITDPVNNQVVSFGNTKWLKPSSTYGPSTFPRQ